MGQLPLSYLLGIPVTAGNALPSGSYLSSSLVSMIWKFARWI